LPEDFSTSRRQFVSGAAMNAMPMILTHGWPGSILEFMRVIGLPVAASAFPGEIFRAAFRSLR